MMAERLFFTALSYVGLGLAFAVLVRFAILRQPMSIARLIGCVWLWPFLAIEMIGQALDEIEI